MNALTSTRYFIFLVLMTGFAGFARAEGEEGRSKNVKLTAESLALVAIETAPVERASLNITLRAPGRVTVNTLQTAKVTSALEGRVVRMNFDLGALVKQGDVMALVDSPDLLGRALELKSPISGRVIERNGTIGEAVDFTKELYTVSDLKNVWVIAEVRERDIATVRVGQSTSIHVTAYPGETFKGAIALIADKVEERSRTIEARIVVDNSDARLKPGMFADVEIVVNVVENVIVIPDDALQSLEDEQVVFVATGQHEFEARTVKIGREQDGRVEIIEGLSEGDRLVTKGSFILKSELLKGELGEE